MKLIRKNEVCQATGHKSHTSLHNMLRAGTLTKPVAISARSVAWPEHEIFAINAARVAGHSDDEIRALVERLHARRAQMAEEAAA